jgi:hypothetical protein
VSKAEELREGMIQQYALSPREIEPMRRRLEVLLAAARAEGVAEGVVTALNGLARYAKRIDGGEYNYAFGKPFFVVPVTAFEEVRVSLLAPKESEK